MGEKKKRTLSNLFHQITLTDTRPWQNGTCTHTTNTGAQRSISVLDWRVTLRNNHSQDWPLSGIWELKIQAGSQPPNSQVANPRPMGQIRPSPCFIQPGILFLPGGSAEPLALSYIFAVQKLHLALWKQLQGWWGPWWKWVWHPC